MAKQEVSVRLTCPRNSTMTLWKPLCLAYPCHAKEARVPTDHEEFRSDTLARRRATTDAKDLLFRLLERKDEGALPDTHHENRFVRATDEPVVPCELLLESGPYSHGLRRQVLVIQSFEPVSHLWR